MALVSRDLVGGGGYQPMKVKAKDRGKLAEGKLVTYFGKLALSQSTVFWRVPDAHAGSMQPAPADFMLTHKHKFFIIECKETQHDHRLPHGNFDPAQVARMRMWKMAGWEAIVLIYHRKLDKWRGYDVDHFIERTKGCWYFTDEPKTLEELL